VRSCRRHQTGPTSPKEMRPDQIRARPHRRNVRSEPGKVSAAGRHGEAAAVRHGSSKVSTPLRAGSGGVPSIGAQSLKDTERSQERSKQAGPGEPVKESKPKQEQGPVRPPGQPSLFHDSRGRALGFAGFMFARASSDPTVLLLACCCIGQES